MRTTGVTLTRHGVLASHRGLQQGVLGGLPGLQRVTTANLFSISSDAPRGEAVEGVSDAELSPAHGIGVGITPAYISYAHGALPNVTGKWNSSGFQRGLKFSWRRTWCGHGSGVADKLCAAVAELPDISSICGRGREALPAVRACQAAQ